ncbi:MAG TPA: hypothetical protein VNS11_07855 [Sphingomicrobium sp.]|nr:hypothetical protein [Sphingomicrobium sp.]
MIAGLAFAAALFGQAPQAEGPASPASAGPSASAKPLESECVPPVPSAGSQEVVVCATKPDGFRINPDVLAAKKSKKDALAGRSKPPERLKDNSCKVVGPAPCIGAPMINVLGAVATAAEVAHRLSKGQEVDSIFVTEPQLTEYQYYQLAKKQREEKEGEAAARKAAAAAKAASATSSKPAF